MKFPLHNFGFSVAVLAVIASIPASGAGLHMPVSDVDPGSGISIYMDSSFDKLPLSGYAPIRLVVRNDSAARRSWDFSFSGAMTYDERQAFRSSARVDVDGKSERIVEVMVPLSTAQGGYSYPRLTMRVSGHGCGNSMAHWTAGAGANSAGADGALFAMSDSLALNAWSQLEMKFTNSARYGRTEMSGLKFEAGSAPGDYRGWLGCDSVWLTEAEWEGFDTIRRQALLDWMKLGGRLHVCHPGTTPAALAGLPPGDSIVGMGRVERTSMKDTTKLVEHMAKTLRAEPCRVVAINNNFQSQWGLRKGVPEVVVHTGLILLFVFVFAILIGPVNLFALAKKKKHMHLFWTTPALSIVASIALALVIVLQDGFGGRGNRLNAVYLDSTAHRAFIAQEQVSRTGVLLSRVIPVREPYFMTAVKTDQAFDSRSRNFEIVDGALAGDWFASRSVQGQLIMAAQASRARVEISAASGAPAIISGIGATLGEIFFHDANGKYWRAADVKQGARVMMKPADEKEFRNWWRNCIANADSALYERLVASLDQENHFFATASGQTEQIIPTLPSVSWNQSALLYFGPVSTPGGGQ